MKKTILTVTAVILCASVAYASEMLTEFQRRDAISLDRPVRNALNFLKQLNFNVASIQKIESVIENGKFVFETDKGEVCFGDQPGITLRCKNPAGILTINIPNTSTTAFVFDTSAVSASELLAEFQRRDGIQLDPNLQDALTYLIEIPYDLAKIQEIESVDTAGKFVFRSSSGEVCFGDPVEKMLRCKNSAGISTVDFQGDSD